MIATSHYHQNHQHTSGTKVHWGDVLRHPLGRCDSAWWGRVCLKKGCQDTLTTLACQGTLTV